MRRLLCFAQGTDGDWDAACADLDIAVQGGAYEEVYDLLPFRTTCRLRGKGPTPRESDCCAARHPSWSAFPTFSASCAPPGHRATTACSTASPCPAPREIPRCRPHHRGQRLRPFAAP